MRKMRMAERVSAGVAFLDARQPGWHKRIRIGDLDISSDCGCVIGQLFESYNDNPLELDYRQARDYGFFEYAGRNRDDRYGRLTALWQDRILERFEPVRYDNAA